MGLTLHPSCDWETQREWERHIYIHTHMKKLLPYSQFPLPIKKINQYQQKKNKQTLLYLLLPKFVNNFYTISSHVLFLHCGISQVANFNNLIHCRYFKTQILVTHCHIPIHSSDSTKSNSPGEVRWSKLEPSIPHFVHFSVSLTPHLQFFVSFFLSDKKEQINKKWNKNERVE